MGTVKFSDLKRMIIRSLEDVVNENEASVAGSTYGADVLKDSIHAALNAVAQRVWKRSVLTVDEGNVSVEVPENFIDVDGVYESNLGVFLPKVSFQVGKTMTLDVANGWFLYPTGSITFLNKIGAGGASVYYQAHWEKPDKDSDIIEAPDTVIPCLVLYAGAYLLGTSSVSSASIRQFNTRVDSGQPGDIPQMKMSDFLMRRYEEELKRIPMMEKGRVQ